MKEVPPMPPHRVGFLFAASLAAAAPAAWAQAPQCSTCEACTAALAAPNAQVELTGDLALRGAGPCVVIRGAGARLNGLGHVLLAQPGGGVGVRVEAADVNVRSLRVTGADVGVAVVGASDVTLYALTVEARAVGVSIERSANARLDRVRTVGGRVGVSFGARDDGACDAGLALRSPGAVVLRSTIEGARTGLAACDARPVLTANTVTHNEVGVVLGAPTAVAGPGGAAPYDACVCAPPIEALHPATAAVFSSGCGSCQVHEGWMPSLRRRGGDFFVRDSAPGTDEAQARFDRYAWRCLPAVMDSLGIPGCVPNYACATSGAVSKRREGAQLVLDTPVQSEDEVLAFAQGCANAALGRYDRGARCVRWGLADNNLCGNRAVDLRASDGAAHGARNRCGRAEGWSDDGRDGCSQRCEDAPLALPRAPLAPPTPPPAEAPVTTVTPGPATSVTATPAAPSSDGPLYLVGGLVAAALAGAWAFRKR